jgi:hypothetical protein
MSSSAGAGPLAGRSGDEVEGIVELAHIVEEDVQIDGQRLGHAVLAVRGRKVVMPLPGFSLEGCLDVHFDLLGVETVAEELDRRLEQARMVFQPIVGFPAYMESHRGTHLAAQILAYIGRTILTEDGNEDSAQHLHLREREEVWHHQKSLALELFDLRFAELSKTGGVIEGAIFPKPKRCSKPVSWR